MRVIDDKGRLFGIINIIDAFVVLVVVIIIVSGVGFVLGQQQQQQQQQQRIASTYVTLDLGGQSAPIARAIEINDTYSPSDGNNLSITDIYRAPQGDNARVLVRAQIKGPDKNGSDSILYNKDSLRISRELTISTDEYRVNGRIISHGDGNNLNVATSRVLVDATVPIGVIDSMSVGDRLSGTDQEETLGTIKSTSVYPSDSPDQAQAVIGLTLQTIAIGSNQRFGGVQIDTGKTVQVHTQQYEFDGEIIRVNTTQQTGTKRTRTVTLRMESVSPAQAERIKEGLVDQFLNRTFARITNIEESPSQVSVSTSDGKLTLAEHPVRKDLSIITALTVRETKSNIYFKRKPIRSGEKITLRLNKTTIHPIVQST